MPFFNISVIADDVCVYSLEDGLFFSRMAFWGDDFQLLGEGEGLDAHIQVENY